MRLPARGAPVHPTAMLDAAPPPPEAELATRAARAPHATARPHTLGVADAAPGAKMAPDRALARLADGDRRLGCLALTQNHLRMPLRRGPEVIDGGEREAFDEAPQVLDLHAACSPALPVR